MRYEEYLKDVKILSHEESIKIFKLYRATGDIKYKNQLFDSISKLVYRIATRYRARLKAPFDDIIQYANLKSLEIIERWNPKKGRLTTFVGTSVNFLLINYHYSQKTFLVHVGRQIKVYIDQLCQEYQFNQINKLSDEEIAEYLGLDQKHTNYPKYIKCAVATYKYIDIDKEKVDILYKEDTDNDFLAEEICHNLINKLDSRSKQILKMRYGINGYYAHTLQEIGTKFGLTREAIRQNISKSLKKLSDESL